MYGTSVSIPLCTLTVSQKMSVQILCSLCFKICGTKGQEK